MAALPDYFFGVVFGGALLLGALPPGAGAAEAAGEAVACAGVADGAGVGAGELAGILSDCSTVRDPDKPGSDSISAISIKAAAAPIVILARILCVPRGPKAVLETLLVNNAPASA